MSAILDIFTGDIRPKPRQRWSEDRTRVIHEIQESSSVGWVELFIDLLYVAQFLLLGHRLYYCTKDKSMQLSEIFGWIFVSFALFWGSRVAIDEFYNKFELPKDFGRLLMLWYTLGIFYMTFNSAYEYCNSEENPRSINVGFIFGLLITRFTLILLYGDVVRTFPEAQKQFSIHLIMQSIIIFLALLTLCVLDYSNVVYGLILTAAILDTFQVIIKAAPAFLISDKDVLSKFYYFPIDIEKTQERHGIFIIMVIGEAIITISEGFERDENLDEMYTYTTGAFLLCCAIAGIYFEEVHANEHDQHVALRNNAITGSLWTTLHMPLSFVIFLIGISIKLLYKDLKFSDDEDYSWLDVKALDITVGICHMIMIFMTSLHTNVIGNRIDLPDYYINKTWWWHIFHILIACNHFWVANAFKQMNTNPKWITIVHAIIFFAHRLFLDLNKLGYYIINKRNEENMNINIKNNNININTSGGSGSGGGGGSVSDNNTSVSGNNRRRRSMSDGQWDGFVGRTLSHENKSQELELTHDPVNQIDDQIDEEDQITAWK